MKYKKQIFSMQYYDNYSRTWYLGYVAYIQVKRFFGWITIKRMESSDKDYLNLCADELIEKLNEEI